jgi:hypothetical protein
MSPVSPLGQNFSMLFVDISQNVLQTENSALRRNIEVFRKIQLVVIAGQGSGFVETGFFTISHIVNDKTKQACNYLAETNIG